MKEDSFLTKYAKYFNESDFFRKLTRFSGKLGHTFIVYLIMLYYLVSDKDIPLKTRIIFIAALGYFILPSDLVADIIPGLGFADDLAFVAYAFSTANDFITPELKEKAEQQADKLLQRVKEKNPGKSD